MTDRETLAQRHASARQRGDTRAQHQTYIELKAATHAALSSPRRKSRMARLWALLVGA